MNSYTPQTATAKQKETQEACRMGLLPQSLSTWLKGVSARQLLSPPLLPIPIVSSPVTAATRLSHALVSLQTRKKILS